MKKLIITALFVLVLPSIGFAERKVTINSDPTPSAAPPEHQMRNGNPSPDPRPEHVMRNTNPDPTRFGEDVDAEKKKDAEALQSAK